MAWGVPQSPGVSPDGALSSADLCDSSNYSSENLEGQSGERFRGKCVSPRVRRSEGGAKALECRARSARSVLPKEKPVQIPVLDSGLSATNASEW